MTKLKYWYTTQNAAQRTEFKKGVIDRCGINERTFYRHLDNEPSKLCKAVISELSGIAAGELYTPYSIL